MAGGGDMQITGFNHLALVCRDMAETVDFYTKVLGMPLVKTVALPDGGQHFFFDCGGAGALAFFWWPEVPPPAPGIASVAHFPTDPKTAVGSMNHVAFSVPEERLDEYRATLEAAGVPTFPVVLNHDDSRQGYSPAMHDRVFVRSVYFTDPNGIMLELAASTRAFGPEDIRHAPRGPAALVTRN